MVTKQQCKVIAMLLFLGISGAPAKASPQLTLNSNQCTCYLVSGSDPGYFQYHRFWDWRVIAGGADDDFTTAPPLITDSQDQGGQSTTSAFFNTTAFQQDWYIQNIVQEPNAAVPNGLNTTYLTLRASRLTKFASISEIDSSQTNVLHSSIRARMKIFPYSSSGPAPFVDNGLPASSIDGLNSSHPVAPGACYGQFTYQSDTQESDIEVLTYDPITNVRYSNQPDFDPNTGDTVPGASSDVALPGGGNWTDWHDHRIDWYDGISRWYVDNQLVLEKTLNAPTKPSGFVLNLWSDGGEWSGNMTVGAQVIAGIEWIEMSFNTSGENSKRDSQLCNVGCNVDGVQRVGHPEINNTSTNSGTNGSGNMAVNSLFAATTAALWGVLLLA